MINKNRFYEEVLDALFVDDVIGEEEFVNKLSDSKSMLS